MPTFANKKNWTWAWLLIPFATVLVFVLLIVVSSRGLSNATEGRGGVDFTEVVVEREAQQFYLNAEADIELSDSMRKGLESGVPLDFLLTLQFLKPRAFWFDQSIAQFRNRFSLTYYELTRHYRVHAVDSDTSHNYRSLSAALRGLGEFDKVALKRLDNTPLPTVMDQYMAGLSLKLDSQSLPLPLQPLITSSWRLASEEYQWLVN